MKRYALDANVMMAHFEGSHGADKIQRLMESADENEAELLMSAIQVGEVFYSLWKWHDESFARQGLLFIQSSPIKILDVTISDAIDAGRLKATYHSGYADSFLASLAITNRATLVTSDPDFKRFADKIKILWLPRHKSVN